jgi:putative membrane protein (TIGR04086 family)
MKTIDGTNGIFQTVKGVGLALAVSFLWAIIMASILRFTALPDAFIYPCNQVAKAIAVGVGTLAFVREEKGLIKGAGIGLLFTALSYLAFSALGGDFSLSFIILIELLIAVLIGALCGALAVNLKR